MAHRPCWRGMTGKRPPPPLDEDALRELALRHVARFATSRGKLLAYLNRKLRERGWAGERLFSVAASSRRRVPAKRRRDCHLS